MKKILVVDDEPEIVKLIQSRLEAEHFEVIAAEDGQEAIRKAQQETPDLIIMDVVMPKMHGTEAVNLLKVDEKTKSIPIIFLTALLEHMPHAEGKGQLNLDGKTFPAVLKPFKSEKLLSEVRKILKD